MIDAPLFTETFTVAADNPLLCGHIVQGRPLLPGVGHVDLVLQVLAGHGYAMADVELRNLAIHAPFTISSGEQVQAIVEGRSAPGNGLRVEIRSRRRNETADVVHAVAHVHRCDSVSFEERLSLPVAGTNRLNSLTDIYAWCQENELVHSGLMKAGGTIHHRAVDWVAELELAPEHHHSAGAFLFHPALFEAALLCGGVASGLPQDGPGLDLPRVFELYLPLVFENFRAAASPGKRCYVRVPAESVRRDDELVRMTVEFYDATGVKIAEVGRYVAKRVRADTALDVRYAHSSKAAAGADGQNLVAVLRELVAARLGQPPERIDVRAGYYELGLASADLLSLVTDLEDRLSLSLSPTIMFEHRTIADLVAWLEPLVVAQPAPSAVDLLSTVRATVIDEVATLLKVPAGEVDPDGELEEFGFDLTSLNQFADRLNDRYGLMLAPSVFFEHRTVRAIAAHLVDTCRVSAQETDARPHPMLHRVVADGDGVTGETRFDGSEPFLRDHQVRGGRVLPGVVHLEMARAAAAHALDGPVRLDNVVWLRPAICGPEGLELRVRVRTESGGYEIYSVDGAGEPTLYSQGTASPQANDRSLPRLDDLRAACAETVFPAAHVYDLYTRAGMDYGPAHQAVVQLGVGTDDAGRPQVLAELRLPAEANSLDGCWMHPSIVDGALQATIGLRLTAGLGEQPLGPALPFAVQRVEPAAPTTSRAYAWIRHQPGSRSDTSTARLDVTVFDEHGRTCADLTGLSTRALPAVPQEAPRAGSPDVRARPAVPQEVPQTVTPGVRTRPAGTDIAIVGVSGRYPEAADLNEFWQNLRSGRDSVREVPAGRWRQGWDAGAEGSANGKWWGGFLDDIDRFDPLFFQISLIEAEYLDPQERLFLECAHHVLEDAGYTGATVAPSGRVGVFVGVMYQEYQLFGAQAQERGRPIALSGSAATIANRVSYFHNFTGPSMAVDTMCSSSLTAIHLACEAIKSGQCEAAIAGGVNLSPHPNKYLILNMRRFLSSDGRCRSFGAGGDGYVPGEGVGAVLLKPLERAIADGDHIHGVIKATAVNHGARTSGYSVPSPRAQGEVIASALASAGLDPRSLSYVEAHGTGTSLGDPIEVEGLAKVFREGGGLPGHCAIGSVKSNIGHSESASGIAGITKVLLQMRHGELVPSLHSSTLNPHIDFDRLPLRVQQRLEPWRRPTLDVNGELRTLPRIAGVSSFGAGGSNAHVVVAEYEPAPVPVRRNGRPSLLVLSAQSEAQLVEQARRLHTRLAELSDDDLPDVAWTLQTGRIALEERLAFAATSVEAARSQLEAFAARRSAGWVRGTVRPGLRSDEGLSSAVSQWSEHGAYERLLGLWVDGAEVDWTTAGLPARRVSLPGYPFARDRCWADLDLGDAVVRQPREEAAEMVLLRPVWVDQDAVPTQVAVEEKHVLVVGRLAAGERDALPAGTTFVEPVGDSLDRQYTDVAQRVFAVVRSLLENGVRRPVLLQVALVGTPDERERLACFGGLTGLLKTASLENPLLHTQYVECLDGASPGTIAARLAFEAAHLAEPQIRHRDGRRQVARLEEVPSARTAAPRWKEGGVYLITGGTGALGLIVARDIAASVGHATVVLIGRSPLSDERQHDLDALRAAGLTVDHQRADVADQASVTRLLSEVAQAHGPLTGILHSAGVVNDGLLLRKTPEDLARVLAPKVAGLVNLDVLTRDQPLEMFQCFSSASGAFGNPGQADYAAANAFMDAYVAYRNHLVEAGERSGRTVSVNWPLWDEGGMGNDGAVREQLRTVGMAPLDTVSGLKALWLAHSAEDGRLVVLMGDRNALLSRLTGDNDEAQPEPVPASSSDVAAALADKAEGYLRRVLSTALKLGPDRLGPETPLERYGMDSVIAVNVISQLEEPFGPLSRTLLFEEQTVRDLARYFAANHLPALRTLLGEPVAPQPVRPAPAQPAPPRPAPRVRTAEPSTPATRGQEIAIIGISGRYPQAGDLDTFWANLRDGKDCVTEIPADRWERLYDAEPDHRLWGGFLDGVDEFDPLFFGISPREAAPMDPQQRLFMETVWHLLEGNGLTQEVIERRYGRRVGVYVGAAYQMYRDASDPVLAALTSTASFNLIANRVSYFFGLEGPSLALDNMCASSATAIHLACADLQRGETELAVAGGVNLTVHLDKYVALSELQLLGSHPGSRSFRDGDGYLPAEAVGAVLLKPLDAALRDGDQVHAVIKGTASAHGGRANGFMTPSHRTQVNVMRRALERAGAEPGTIGYVEAAANGSTLADAVEVRALREVFGGVTEQVAVGTVKSTLGHPEAASGIAQLTKVVLQLRHQELAPLVDAGSPNPGLDLDGTSLRLCDRLTAWESSGPRRALINSVAAGGSHVSLVIEAPPRTEVAPPSTQDSGRQLVVLSAGDSERLRAAARRLCEDLDERVELADLAYTTQLGREALPERLAVVVASREELKQALAHHVEHGSVGAIPVHLGNADEDSGTLNAVLHGVRGEKFLSALVADGDLDRLAELWVRGAVVPWSGLHRGSRRLTTIPVTVFDKASYWIGQGHGLAAAAPADLPVCSDTEQTMVAIWAELLQIEPAKLGATSDFFSLGGNSLLVTRLINLIERQTGVALSVQAVFDAPRLADLVAELERRLPDAVDGSALEADRILESIGLIESLTDEELDALLSNDQERR